MERRFEGRPTYTSRSSSKLEPSQYLNVSTPQSGRVKQLQQAVDTAEEQASGRTSGSGGEGGEGGDERGGRRGEK